MRRRSGGQRSRSELKSYVKRQPAGTSYEEKEKRIEMEEAEGIQRIEQEGSLRRSAQRKGVKPRAALNYTKGRIRSTSF